jgi:hypothetical protein
MGGYKVSEDGAVFEMFQELTGGTATPQEQRAQELKEKRRAVRTAAQEVYDQSRELYETSDLKFAGDAKAPTTEILKERPEHRIIVYLKAQGRSNTEIAKITGYTKPWLTQVCAQPWFKLQLTALLHEKGGDMVQNFLEGQVMNTLETLVEIRDNSDKDATRLAAANSILDRAFGKPTQHIKTEAVADPTNAQTEMSSIERELAMVKEQQRTLGMGPN